MKYQRRPTLKLGGDSPQKNRWRLGHVCCHSHITLIFSPIAAPISLAFLVVTAALAVAVGFPQSPNQSFWVRRCQWGAAVSRLQRDTSTSGLKDVKWAGPYSRRYTYIYFCSFLPFILCLYIFKNITNTYISKIYYT